MGELLYFLRRMLPGCLLALALWAAVLPLRRHQLARLGLQSSRGREWLLAAFVAFCGGMAILTLTPPGFDLIKALRGNWHGRFFRRGRHSL